MLWFRKLLRSCVALREKYPYLELFWSVFSLIRTEYGPEQLEYGHFLRSVVYVATMVMFSFSQNYYILC